MKETLEHVAYRLIGFLFYITGRIPLRQGQRIGARLGRLIHRLDRRHRRIAEENIVRAFGEMPLAERNALTLRVFENLGKILFEMAWSLRLDEKKFFRYFRIEGAEHIHNAHAGGKGVLALTAHFGNWELLTVIAAMIRHPLSVVYRPLDFKPMERFIVAYRTRFGGSLIPKKKTFRRVLRAVKQRDMVALLMDQNVAWREGVFADFFGHPACTNKGLALLALKTESPVVPVFLAREENGFVAKFLPPLPLIRTGDRIKDVELNTEQYNRVIEAFVRQHPAQWFWVHRRWNTKPFYPWPRDK